MKYCAAYYSDIGIQKETNQDSLLLVQRGQTQDDEAVLAVICDGVGCSMTGTILSNRFISG